MMVFPFVSKMEVVILGEVPKTAEPDPVSSVKAPERLAEVKELKEVVLPMEEMAPERLASVVTVAAFPPIERFVTGVVEATTNGALPVTKVEVN